MFNRCGLCIFIIYSVSLYFFFNYTATSELYPDGHPLSLHAALPILTFVSTLGPSPISVAPLIGVPSLPFSILYASVQEKTNLPDTMSTKFVLDRKSTRLNSSH